MFLNVEMLTQVQQILNQGPWTLVIRASQIFATREPTRRVTTRVMKCDADVHEEVYTYVVLSGDTTTFQDKVICPPERNHAMWIGQAKVISFQIASGRCNKSDVRVRRAGRTSDLRQSRSHFG